MICLFVERINHNKPKRTTFHSNIDHDQPTLCIDMDTVHPRIQATLHQQENTADQSVSVWWLHKKSLRQHPSIDFAKWVFWIAATSTLKDKRSRSRHTPISQDPRIQTRQLDGHFLVPRHTLDENLLDKTSTECRKLPEPTSDVTCPSLTMPPTFVGKNSLIVLYREGWRSNRALPKQLLKSFLSSGDSTWTTLDSENDSLAVELKSQTFKLPTEFRIKVITPGASVKFLPIDRSEIK